jgi:hypothetical protein
VLAGAVPISINVAALRHLSQAINPTHSSSMATSVRGNSKVEVQSKRTGHRKDKGMQLRRPGQEDRGRAAVFIAVLGLHLLLGLVVFGTGTNRIARLRADSPLSLLSLSRENPPKLPAALPASMPKQKFERRESPRDIEPPPRIAELEPSHAITLLDLGGEADAAARRQSDLEENERRWRNFAGPSESQLEWWRHNTPLARDDHQLGDTEHAAGGELITWVNDKCYFTTHGITTFGLPQTSKVCKDPPKPETDLFQDMRKKLDEGAMGRAP